MGDLGVAAAIKGLIVKGVVRLAEVVTDLKEVLEQTEWRRLAWPAEEVEGPLLGRA